MTRTIEAFGNWHQGLGVDTRSLTLAGAVAVALMLGGGGTWASLAPLSGAVMAPGIVVATGQNRSIQHFEGGIISEILVREGDLVGEGQVILRLNRTAAAASLKRLEDQHSLLLATRARHIAERDGAAAIRFPDESESQRQSQAVIALHESQQREFDARRESLAAEIAVLRMQIAGKNEEIDGITAQRQATIAQAALIAEELGSVKSLFDQGLAEKSRVLALERAAAQLLGAEGEMTARLAQGRQEVAAIESRILNVRSAWKEKVTADLGRTEADLADVGERLKAARDVAERIEVKAPVRGIVVKLHVNSVGGVIQSGEPVMDILPSDDGLEIEARISPADVDDVFPGRPAQLRFSGLRQRTTPTIAGRVHYVSADRLTDRSTQQAYYVARIRMTGDLPGELRDFSPLPGMPVEVFVETGSRTFIEYLWAPVGDSLARAFREQ